MGTNPGNRKSDNVQKILDEIRRLVRFLRVSARAAEKHLGISGAQLFILQTLDQSDGPMSVNELAEKTRTHQSSVSVVVQKLVAHKMIRRAKARTDARQLALSLTPAARTLLRRSPGSALHMLIASAEALTQRQQEQLAQLLALLNTELGLDQEAPRLMFEDDGASNHGRSRHAARR